MIVYLNDLKIIPLYISITSMNNNKRRMNQWKKKANQWKNAHGNRERQRRYAWARYFEETRRQHNLNYTMYENMNEVKRCFFSLLNVVNCRGGFFVPET